ncbi:glycosyltransferase family 2 protein [Evansella cellulosilytica]|uniref:Glycosyl transferase family 2 n=1 Tax=Evansella cellulosilytica (strain ATCC 21833 / DSM 2522 / FERM P-1141 / JCM 9156 / N-4) TaxID=649639 RepID=E6TUX0_EVAC2|nr:glycosyltransferase family 2 protein [Evansella cellulosilytica]ADU32122.1 glycosyl transferase family 2 [Evansella cellulosilytica DSM 2522]
MEFTIVIPAYNEGKSIGKVLAAIEQAVSDAEVIVVDDCSTDDTVQVASQFSHVRVIKQSTNGGPIEAIATGIVNASHDVVVTIDADGQHPVASIHDVVRPILNDQADIVLGVRNSLPRLGEKIIARFSGVSDATTGFKAMRKTEVENFKDDTAYGGMLLVKEKRLGKRIAEVPITVREREEGVSVHSNYNILKKSIRFAYWALFKK